MDERTKTAFEFARDSTQQLITLATGVVAIGITFSKEFAGPITPTAKGWAVASWGAFLVSVFFGLWSLLALTGTLADAASKSPTIRGSNVTIPATLQVLTFLIGLILTVVFGFLAG
ncbi:MAG TPA: hypothetical protein VMP01_02225 [Pirellulaceae bacterium]|nr:hypothetical protein [Pirellulaceae bacterium]